MSSSSDLKEATNGSTLKEQKFKPNESISAFKKSVFAQRKAPIVQDNKDTGEPELTHKAYEVVQEIFNRFCVEDQGEKVMM